MIDEEAKYEVKNEVGDRIKTLRKEQDLTQSRFALMTGINRSYLADIEMGNRNFGIDTLTKIAKGFGLTFEEFFRGVK